MRRATESDVAAITELTNRAYEVEKFFVDGDRTSPDEIRGFLDSGLFLVVDGEDGRLAASVFVRIGGGRGYFGLLAVDPALQGQGLGRRMVTAAEAMCRDEGCAVMDLRVVNLRTELPPWYRSLGYEECGIEPFPDDAETSRPCHFIRMSKSLASG